MCETPKVLAHSFDQGIKARPFPRRRPENSPPQYRSFVIAGLRWMALTCALSLACAPAHDVDGMMREPEPPRVRVVRWRETDLSNARADAPFRVVAQVHPNIGQAIIAKYVIAQGGDRRSKRWRDQLGRELANALSYLPRNSAVIVEGLPWLFVAEGDTLTVFRQASKGATVEVERYPINQIPAAIVNKPPGAGWSCVVLRHRASEDAEDFCIREADKCEG